MIRALVVALSLTISPANAGCLIGCDEQVTGAQAAALWASVTGLAPPPGVTVTQGLAGGFQDPFYQLRAEADADGLAALLASLNVSAADFGLTDGTQTTITPQDWWQPDAPGATAAPVSIGTFPFALLIRVPDPARPGMNAVYLVAFQT